MAAIFEELVLTWGGKEYRVTPDMRLLNKIEQQGVSLSGIILRTAQGEPPISHIATAVYYILTSSGARASWDDVYSELSRLDGDVLTDVIDAIRRAAFPYAGKDEAPATESKKPTGASSTKSRRKPGE